MNIIEMENISKYFSVNNAQALNGMNLYVDEGEIHAIAGENGAGKSTLMKILHGVEKPDSGTLQIKGNTGMVSQHFRLVDDLTVLDNIIIGLEPLKYRIFINRKKARLTIKEILNKYNFNIDLNQKVNNLSIGQKQLVEIIKVIYDNRDILIFDEPTSALSEPEAEKLRRTLLKLKDNGKTIIIISHKIKDISSVSDRFTIMRKGKFIKTVETDKVTIDEISRYMSGTNLVETIIDSMNPVGDELLKIQNSYIDITLHEKEIIGITGYGDCGLRELEEELEEYSQNRDNIGYTPSDRLNKGVELTSTLRESLFAAKRKEFTRNGLLKQKEINSYTRSLIKKNNIKGDIKNLTGTLSGGNLQKSVLARILDMDPKILFLCSPTWGIDLESTNRIYSKIKDLKNRGRGIILLSSDTEEVLKLANRILILYKGRVIKDIVNNHSATPEYLGLLSSGISYD